MHFWENDTCFGNGRILTLILIIFVFTVTACSSQTPPTTNAPIPVEETNNSSPSATPSATPSSTPSPTATTDLSLDGRQILQNAIDALNNRDAYEMELILEGSLGNNQTHCIVNNTTTLLCQRDSVTSTGARNQPLVFQINGNAWYKDNPDEPDWNFVPSGFKTGFSGLNDLALVEQITTVTEVIVEGIPLYQVEYKVESELLLQLILQDASQAPEFIAQAKAISIEGVSFIDSGTYLPIREFLSINIESETKPLTATSELRYNFISPAEIELPLGENLLQIGHDFFMAISDARLEEAYDYLAAEAQAELSQEAFANFIETYSEMFTRYESMKLEAYDNSPEITGVAGEFVVLFVQVAYSDREAQTFRLIYIKNGNKWGLARFDAIVSQES